MSAVGVIGAGYVGLVTAAGLASLGHRVVLTERDPERVRLVSEGRAPFHEPGVDAALADALAGGTLTVSGRNTDVLGCDVVLLALPTPPLADGSADTAAVESVLDELRDGLDREVLAIRSTVPIGTIAAASDRLGGRPVVANPEFLREGRALDDFLHPDRVVVGADDPAAGKAVLALYEGLPGERILTDPITAELVKYASNAYLAARITFVNGLANLATAVGADIETVTRGMGLDPRIGPEFLRPGPGYGGSCFPKDIVALIARSREAGFPFDLLEAVVAADDDQRRHIVERLSAAVGGLDGRRVALWGLAFKSGTDDTRVSPAVKLAVLLTEAGAEVVAHDPLASPPAGFPGSIAAGPVDAATGADAVLVATEWPQYGTVDLAAVAEAMVGDVLFDARNVVDRRAAQASGLRYLSLGRRLD